MRMVGPAHLPLLIRECFNLLEEKVGGTLQDYFKYGSQMLVFCVGG